MKKTLNAKLLLLLIGIFLITIVGNVVAQTYTIINPVNTVLFEWDYNNPPTDLAEFRLYQSTQSGVYTYGEEHQIATSGKTDFNVEIANVPQGKLYFVVTAVDTLGNESLPSNEITLIADYSAPDAPSNFRCLNLNIHIEIN